MARRIELTVPQSYAEDVRVCLKNADKCNLNDVSDRQATIVEVNAKDVIVFYVTLPAADIGRVLNVLKSAGCGTSFGTVMVTTLDCMKPSFETIKAAKELRQSTSSRKRSTDIIKEDTKKKRLGFNEFQSARLTTEEIYNRVADMTKMNLNVWINLLGSCFIAGAGLIGNSTVVLVAAMLISPLMGPILGATFGYRIADWRLAWLGLKNEIIMASTGFLVGCVLGLVVGPAASILSWPTAEMVVRGQFSNLCVSMIVAASSGTVLGVSITAGGVSSMVGVALSASLLPPIINSGILAVYSGIYADPSEYIHLRNLAGVSFALYLTSVSVIFLTANTVFSLKEISKTFQTKDDTAWSDFSMLGETKKKMHPQAKRMSVFARMAQAAMEAAGNEEGDPDNPVGEDDGSVPPPKKGVVQNPLTGHANI